MFLYKPGSECSCTARLHVVQWKRSGKHMAAIVKIPWSKGVFFNMQAMNKSSLLTRIPNAQRSASSIILGSGWQGHDWGSGNMEVWMLLGVEIRGDIRVRATCHSLIAVCILDSSSCNNVLVVGTWFLKTLSFWVLNKQKGKLYALLYFLASLGEFNIHQAHVQKRISLLILCFSYFKNEFSAVFSGKWTVW